MASALEAANALLSLDGNENKLNHMQVHKLLFIANGYHLAIFDKPLVTDEDPILWRFGVVWNNLYHKLKHYGLAPIEDPLYIGEKTISDYELSTIRDVLNQFGHLSAVELSQQANLAIDVKVSLSNDYKPQSLNMDRIKNYYRGWLPI